MKLKKILFDLITSPLTISDNYFIDFIIMSIISLVAYKIAYKVVGDIGFRGEVGSIFHWIIRFIIFGILWLLCSIALKIGLFVINHKVFVLCLCCFILLVCITIKIISSRNKNELAKN